MQEKVSRVSCSQAVTRQASPRPRDGFSHPHQEHMKDTYNTNSFFSIFFKTVLSSGYISILLSIEYILASLIEMCQGKSRMRNVK